MQRAAADQLQSDFRESALNPNAVMMTPLVLEIIAEKRQKRTHPARARCRRPVSASDRGPIAGAPKSSASPRNSQ
jgi:hypothetical protein